MRWACEIPRAEGQWLAGPAGPLASLPGSATWAAGVLVLDHEAFRHLEHLGTISADDGRVTWPGSGVPVIHAGGAAYPLEPVGDESPLRQGVPGATGG